MQRKRRDLRRLQPSKWGIWHKMRTRTQVRTLTCRVWTLQMQCISEVQERALDGFNEGVHAFINKQRYSRGNRDSVMMSLTAGEVAEGSEAMGDEARERASLHGANSPAWGRERKRSIAVGSGPLC